MDIVLHLMGGVTGGATYITANEPGRDVATCTMAGGGTRCAQRKNSKSSARALEQVDLPRLSLIVVSTSNAVHDHMNDAPLPLHVSQAASLTGPHPIHKF
jgi:hypothetical protein